MTGITILGTGRHLPSQVIANEQLARVMDTSSAWIEQRTGIRSRHFAADGEGASDLAVPACERAIAAAGLEAADIDYVLFNTMTPDYAFPGCGPLLATRLGMSGVPALDLRQQCASIPYSLMLADALVRSDTAQHVLITCAEAHAGFMPWRDWQLLEPEAAGRASGADYELATQHRGMSVLFGDGAGALVVGRAQQLDAGLLSCKVHSDGQLHNALRLNAGGFLRRPYLTPDMLERAEHVPRMNGRELFRAAVHNLPKVVADVCSASSIALDDVDWFVAHQANGRINQAVREALRQPDAKFPSNIERYGNTSSASIPILFDELIRDGRVRRGQLVCFLALGAGLHWGAALMRL